MPYKYTSRGNLVAVISNGTAVLGLGAIGALAGKPVMEGKAVLFKKFAGIDAIDIEIEERDPKKLIEVIAPLEPTFGGINLEDIKAPECFEIEEALRERDEDPGVPRRPARHRDHRRARRCSTASSSPARTSTTVKIATSGAGAAAIACLNMLLALGRQAREHLGRRQGGLSSPRSATTPSTAGAAAFAQDTEETELAEVMRGADIYRRPLGRRAC